MVTGTKNKIRKEVRNRQVIISGKKKLQKGFWERRIDAKNF